MLVTGDPTAHPSWTNPAQRTANSWSSPCAGREDPAGPCLAALRDRFPFRRPGPTRSRGRHMEATPAAPAALAQQPSAPMPPVPPPAPTATAAAAASFPPETAAKHTPEAAPIAAPAAAAEAPGSAMPAVGGAPTSPMAPGSATAAGAAASTPAPMASNSKWSLMYWLTKIQPTNYDMLVFRTLNQDLRLPNHNNDYLAVKLRDELMPIRSWCLRNLPWTKHQAKSVLENRVFGVPGCINFIDARTKWFDSAVVEATTWKDIRQVVIVAAGYDTRAYRLAQPGVTFFEVDLPVASARKQKLVDKLKIVPPGGRRPVYVAADLSRVDLKTALEGTGFNSSLPTLFTVEGLIYYLPDAAAHRLVASIGSLSAPGSMLYFDFMQSAALNGKGKSYPGFKVTAKAVANKGEPYLSGLDDSPEAVQQFVGLHGFRLHQYLSPKDMVALTLPHVTWDDRVPPIASFYSYAAVMKQ